MTYPIDSAGNSVLLSVVVPCYNEAEVINQTIDQLTKVCRDNDVIRYEFIFVDDGSGDGTGRIIKNNILRDRRIKLVGLARNFGHQIAVTAGIDAANGDAVVLIDADLQDPPEIIEQMINKWREGYDVVSGQRIERLGDSRFKKMSAHLFYRVLNKLSDVPVPLDTGDFRLMSRSVVDTLSSMPEHDRFIRGMVSWVGFRQTSLPYRRAERYAGTSKYPLKKMLMFALDGIISFSSKPLHLSVVMGIFSAFLALVGIIYALFLRLFTNIWVEGWTALIISVLFIGGVQLICIGILGEYIGRIYKEIKSRPLYVVQEYTGFGDVQPKTSRSPVSIRN